MLADVGEARSRHQALFSWNIRPELYMKRLVSTRRRLVIEVLAVAIAFILVFCAHALWIRRKQIIDIWNNIFLYYQD